MLPHLQPPFDNPVDLILSCDESYLIAESLRIKQEQQQAVKQLQIPPLPKLPSLSDYGNVFKDVNRVFKDMDRVFEDMSKVMTLGMTQSQRREPKPQRRKKTSRRRRKRRAGQRSQYFWLCVTAAVLAGAGLLLHGIWLLNHLID